MAKYYETITLLLLFCHIKPIWTQDTCMNSQYIKPGQTYSVNNPLYPKKYRTGTGCTWFFSTSANYEVRLKCPIVDLPKLRNVSAQRMLKQQKEFQRRLSSLEESINPMRSLYSRSPEWDSWLKNFTNLKTDSINSFLSATSEENQFGPNCKDYLTVISSGNYSKYCQPFNTTASTITMVLSSSKRGQGGVFACNVTSHKIRTLPFQPIENCQCGWTFTTKSRIVGGRDAEVNEFPSIAAVTFEGKPWCSATIIAPRVALSASHCYHKDRNVNNYQLVVGEHDTSKTNETGAEKRMKLSKIIIHKSYKNSVYMNDIALLITEQEIEYSPKVGPACLPFSIDKDDIMGQFLTVAGWGRLTYGGKQPDILQTVQQQVVEDSHCIDTYNRYYYMYNSSQQICAYNPGKDACRGDSGGPLYYTDPETNRSIIVGIVSYADGCGTTTPSVNVDVKSFLPWIMETLSADLQTCGKSNW